MAATALPLAGIGWLGWKVVEQDRAAEWTRLVERREQAVSIASTALQRVLAEAEEQLTGVMNLSAGPSSEPGLAFVHTGAAAAMFDRQGLVARGGPSLPYYPSLASEITASSTLFAATEQAEFLKNDPAAAIAALQPLTRSHEPSTRAEALLRIARNYRKVGDLSRAETAYQTLESYENTRVDDIVVGLAASQGRALLLHAAGRTTELRQAAAKLSADLERGRWVLTKAQYEHGRRQAHIWIGQTDAGGDDAHRLALADTIDIAWREWLALANGHVVARGRRVLQTEHGPTLLLWRATVDRVAVFVIGRRFLETAWLAEVQSSIIGEGIAFALTDADGRPVIGGTDVPVSEQSVRTASITALPWTVHAISTGSPRSEISRATELAVTALVMTVLVLMTSAYFIRRSVSRELAVAKVQSDFVAAVSHEFRTPLTTLRQLSEMLAQGRVSNADRRQQFYDTLLHESERLHRLVEGLLNFGRMEARAIEYDFQTLDPASLVRDVVAEFQQEVAGAGYVVDVTDLARVPAIRADRESLSRVLWNLLDNGVKYSPDDRTVRVELEQAANRVLLRVRDRGMGIPPHEQVDIFGKFVRGAAAKLASIRGTGIGLAMAKQIVEAHGGEIVVASAPGSGSVFTVSLPIVEKAEQ